MRKVLFVCHGNICRSVMAEYILKSKTKDIYCESRATSNEEIGNDIYPQAKRCLDRYGVKYNKHSATRITKNDYDNFDEIYVMDSYNMSNILRIIDDKDHKIKMLGSFDIEDPWYTTNFDKVFDEINKGIDSLI